MPVGLILTNIVVSAKSFLFVLFLLMPTALHSNIGHEYVYGIEHHALFECGAISGSKKKGNRNLFALATTLVSASVNGP